MLASPWAATEDRSVPVLIIATPWRWFKNKGVVTGGDFEDKNTCYPYTMPFCAHHVESKDYKECSDVKQVEPTCSKKCANSENYAASKVHATDNYSLPSIDQIKTDIQKYGSVTAAFTVYEDFVNYKSGVYRHISGKALGGHAIKILGWGTDYWLAMNSWNQTWGDNGLFKIAYGECGIDSQIEAGTA